MWSESQWFAVAINFGYEILQNYMWNGQTLGKRLLAIRTVRESGEPMDLYTVLVLQLSRLSMILLGLDAFWSLFNFSGDYKCLHNVTSGTLVVYTKPPENTTTTTTLIS